MVWLSILELIAAAALVTLASRHSLHMFQLESYQLPGYRNHQKRYPMEWKGWTLRAGLIAEAAVWLLPVLFSLFTGERTRSTLIAHLAILIFTAVYGGVSVYREFTAPQKKKFVLTKRMKRLVAAQVLTILVCLGLVCALNLRYDSERGMTVMKVISPFLLLTAVPWLVYISARIVEPVEKKINEGFYNAAKAKLAAAPKCLRIGITGSYGKTSTKFALKEILSVKYKVVCSPESINTPMGLSKFINEKFNNSYEILIAEMGARHVGDITELTNLIQPEIGLITSIGPQHLDTFHNVETVAKTKNELIKALPKGGAGFFASDGAFVDKLYEKCPVEKHLTAADKKDDRPEMWAENIHMSSEGCHFTLCDNEGGKVPCTCQMLRRHNVSNILVCACVAKKLGLTLEEIAQGIANIKPIEHRLQILRGPVTVLDDAFNSNPAGAKEAVEILKLFPGRHLVVTPGMVEMGEKEDEFNYTFGTQIAANCDSAILVGPRHTAPIHKALKDAGFPEENIAVVRNLEEATALLGRFAGNGDTVLFENDLPDNYAE